MFSALFVATTTALAGGTVSPAPPPPPSVDFAGLPATADVQPKNPDGKNHPVHARLLVDRTAVAPGDTFRVGLHLTQVPEWHTYWKSPGDIGLPTNITWQLPDGATVEPYQYPVPQRFESEDLVSFGYDDQVLLFATVTMPADAKPGDATIGAKADWLVCKTSCIPGEVELSSTLTVGPGGKASGFAPMFDHYAAQHPKKASEVDGIDVTLALSHDAVLPYKPFKAALVVTGKGKVKPDTKRYAFAPIVGDGWMINSREIGHQGDTFVARLDGETLLDEPPESDWIGGLFLLDVDGKSVAIEVQQPLPWKPEGAAVQVNDDPVLKLPVAASTPPKSPEHAEGRTADENSFENAMNPPASTAAVSLTGSGGPLGALGNLFFAFIGGLLLNIMPCVLPVLTLKLYSLVEQTDITSTEQRTAGLAYTGGILASFWALAGTIIGLRLVFGMEVDWGFQFQYPPYVAALATIVFAFGLSLFGVFEIPAMGVSTASAAGSKEGPVGYFFTGVFATLLATPCSAPFLGTAIAFALGASTPMLFGIFSLVGLGLAAPFLLIAFVPTLYRMLPKPGPWMETFKQLLGFTLVATAVWLTGVLGTQIGLDRLIGFLAFLMFVSAGCWVFGHFGGVAASTGRQFVSAGIGIVIAVVGGFGFLDLEFADEPVFDDGTVKTELDFSEHIPWQPFSEKRLAQLEGKPVFVDFTAEWCLTCKVNEKTILETSSVRDAMAANGVVPLKADWTRRDQTITDWLHRYGKAGVPFYLVIPATGDPIPLGEVITPGMVIEALGRSKG